MIGELVDRGFPPGVVNIVTGGPAPGRPLVAHPLTEKIAFTGSTATGAAIAKLAAEQNVIGGVITARLQEGCRDRRRPPPTPASQHPKPRRSIARVAGQRRQDVSRYGVAGLLIFESVRAMVVQPKRVIDGLAATAKWLEEDSAYWPRWVDAFLEHPNTFTSGIPAFVGNDGQQAALGRRLNFVGWRIQPDEALVIDVKPPEVCSYWNFELGDRWWNSTDYRYRLSSLNCKQAELASDGTIWAVVSHQDPGIANWLDVGGNIEGSVNQRWVDATESPLPRARLVKMSELDQVLPKELKRLTPAERREQLRRRKIGVDRRFPV